MSLDVALLPHAGDVITTLASDETWEQVGDDVSDIVEACKELVENWYSDMLIGSVFPWLSTPPAGWLILDGSTYSENDYPELFAVLDAVLKSGSDFTLPDTEQAFPFGVLVKADAGLVVGSNTLNLTEAQMPAHTHTEIPPIVGVDVGGAGPPLPSATVGGAISTGSTGSGDDVDVRPKRFGLILAVFAGRTT